MLQTQPLIEAQGIHHQFGNTLVLKNISLCVRPKEIVTLIGPNGAGKSTLLRILLGLIKPTSGRVSQKPDLQIGFMPQKIQIDATLPLSVERFLTLGFKKHPKNKKYQSLIGWGNTLFSLFSSEADNTTSLQRISAELNILSLLNKPIQQVSGGEMQRILLARALIRDPELLVLDEPVQGVDIQGQADLYQYIDQIRHQRGCGILMVSHDLYVVMQHTDQVLCLNQHICCSGHPQEVSESAEFHALFGKHTEGIGLYEHHHNRSICNHIHGQSHIYESLDTNHKPQNSINSTTIEKRL